MASLAMLVMLASAPARADIDSPAGGSSQTVVPEYRNVGVDEHPNVQVPMDLRFCDERGQPVRLGDYFRPGRPVVLQLGYLECPKLCDVVSRGFVMSAKKLSLQAGSDYTFLFVSIDGADTPGLAALKKHSFLEEYERADANDGFHFLVGNPEASKELARIVGFRYNVVANGQFSHPSVLMVLSPDGHLSRYLYGVTFPSDTLELSVVEAAKGQVGSSYDELALMICCYDPATGKYTLAAERLMSAGGVFTMIVLGASIAFLSWHRRKMETSTDANDSTIGKTGGGAG